MLLPIRTISFIATLALGCAVGSDEGNTSTTGGGVAWTTVTGAGGASAGGSSSEGGGGQAAGGSGDGGRPTTNGGGGAGGAPRETDRALLIGVGSATVMTGAFDSQNGWTTGTLTGGSLDRPAIAMRGQNDAVAMFRNAGNLAFTTFDGSGWSATASVGASITTRATPALVSNSATAFAVFHGDNFLHYFSAYTASFNPSNESVGSPQSFGPSAAAVTLWGSEVVIAYAGSDGDLYDQRRSGGVWQAANPHALGDVVALSPAVVTLDSNQLLVVYVHKVTGAAMFTVFTGSVWSAPAIIDDALTADPLALTALPTGKAMAAFRGTDGQPYAMTFDAAPTPTWSAPMPIASPNPTTPSTPAVAPGVGSQQAELAFVDAATGGARHVRWSGSSWSTPTVVGGSDLTGVAIATLP